MTPEAAVPALKVLYIDDDPALSRLVQKDLVRNGYLVELAVGGDPGLARLREAPFDVVVLDHFMPGREGLEVLAEIRALPESPPVVYATATHEGRVAVAALKAGAADYVIKSADEDFTSLLRAAIDDAAARERLRREKEAAEAEVRAARDRAETLLREVNHRVGNSLQLVGSFISLQARAVQDQGARDALRVTQARLDAVAQVHRRLYTSQDVTGVDLAEYLAALVEELRHSLLREGEGRTILLEAAAVRVRTDHAVSLGVALAELVTNAVKYAYPAGAEGEIRVRLEAPAPGQGLLTVEDDGVGFGDSGPQGTGLGRKILNSMARSLGSAVEQDPDWPGARLRMAFKAVVVAPQDVAESAWG